MTDIETLKIEYHHNTENKKAHEIYNEAIDHLAAEYILVKKADVPHDKLLSLVLAKINAKDDGNLLDEQDFEVLQKCAALLVQVGDA